jgi:hypothetical protein
MPVKTKDLKDIVAEYKRSLRTGKPPYGYASLDYGKRVARAIISRLEQTVREREARYGKRSS